MEIAEEDIFIVKARQAVKIFEGEWLPVPFFKENSNVNMVNGYLPGPTTWARMKILPLVSNHNNSPFTHEIIFAFDTQTANPEDYPDYIMPRRGDIENDFNPKEPFSLASGLDNVFPLVPSPNSWGYQWIDEYGKEGIKRLGLSKRLIEDYEFYPLATYLTLLKSLSTLDIPKVILYDTQEDATIEVDLVLDIGNSRTCGLILETSSLNRHKPFSFHNASSLEIRNLSQPNIVYDNAFEMSIAFTKTSFGKRIKESGRERAFEWPSLVRVGNEAILLSSSRNIHGFDSTLSSPKRYLWDSDPKITNWKNLDGSEITFSELTTFFDDRGEILDSELVKPLNPKYSRKSLMTFSLIEIILQALSQINSYKFRYKSGTEYAKRILKRVVLTTPTAMLESDKKEFWNSAQSALKALRKFYKLEEVEIKYQSMLNSDLEIVPNGDNIGKRRGLTDWRYDEATCSQLVFLYSEIKDKYQNSTDKFFELEGKIRNYSSLIKSNQDIDLNELGYSNKKAVTIASLDIGGGTTDLMICSYLNNSANGTAVITPIPEFYEGFNIAGDDILKRIVERILIPQIEEYAISLGCSSSQDVMNYLFGSIMGKHDALAKEMKKLFSTQMALPIATEILKQSIKKDEVEIRLCGDFFGESINRPYGKIVEFINSYINSHGAENFDIYKVPIRLHPDEIEDTIKQILSPILKKLTNIIHIYSCDFILLAGRPTKLPIIRDIINRFLPIRPDKVIKFTDYRIGNWYPFANERGTIDDPKTVVAVGASIALMGGKLARLDGFRIDTKYLKDIVTSTANYIGGYNHEQKRVQKVWFNNKGNQEEEELKFDGPIYIGMKQLNIDDWISTPMFKLMFRDNSVAKDYQHHLPFKVELERKSKEKINIIAISSIGTDIRLKNDILVLKPQTIIEDEGYWIDSGVFHLSKFNRKS